ncbi:MAG: hypothetical protein L0Z62_35745 [Gemmataceae bacterium]|nr:hypothetical protein [Gemmataceae bacterium]
MINRPREFGGERKASLHDRDHEGIVADRNAIERWENEGGRALAMEAGTSRPSNQPLLGTHYRRHFMATAPTFKTRIELPADRREKLIALLNQHLADTFDLYGQSKQAHWNVKGSQFYQLHELYDELADQAEEYGDLIAERATAV